jgi:transcriptional regulator with XRE-family HTH domain
MCRMPAILKKPSELSVVAREVYRRMAEQGLKQKELALRSGLNETYVRDILTGKSQNPRLAQLAMLAKGLGCEVSDLTQPKSESGSPETIDNVQPPGILPLRPGEIPLLRIWRLLGHPARDRVMELMVELLPSAPRKR